jgi:hypothetical protein
MSKLWNGFVISSALSLCVASAFADDNGQDNFALAFKGSPGLASTAPGAPLTLQDNELRLEATVRAGRPGGAIRCVARRHAVPRG